MISRLPAPRLLLDLFGLAVALFSCVLLVSGAGSSVRLLQDAPGWSPYAGAALLAAAASYALAHLLRAIRLWLIIGTDRLGFSTVFGCHATVALFTFATPFKLGELLRATEFFRLLRDDARGFFAVWIDRLFDVSVILILLLGLTLSNPAAPAPHLVFVSLGGFLLFSITLGLLLPGAVAAFMRALLQSRSRRSLQVLRGTLRLRSILSGIPRLDAQTLSLLCIVTFAVWGLELATLLLILMALPAAGSSVPRQAVEVLNNILMFERPADLLHLALYGTICIATLSIMAALGAKAYAGNRIALPPCRTLSRQQQYTAIFRPARPAMKGRIR